MTQARTRIPVLDRHRERVDDQLLSHPLVHGPTQDFPISEEDEEIIRANHLQWIEARRRLEERRRISRAQSTASAVPVSIDNDTEQQQLLLPTGRDVLFGRGRPYQEHPGNVRFSLVIESLKPRYESLKRAEKTRLAEDLVKKMKARGMRFLRQSNGYWEDADDSAAREKVSQGFRSLRSDKQSSKGNKGSEKVVQDDTTPVEPDQKRLRPD